MPRKTFRKTLYLENLGCAKNQVDGEALVSVLLDRGWLLADTPDEAGLIIVNTCGFIEAARKESINSIMDFRRRYPRAKIIAAGCLSERYAEELAEQLYEANGIFGNRDLARIADFAESLCRETSPKTPYTGRLSATHGGRLLLPVDYADTPPRKKVFSPPGCVYIKAAEGCDNACAYCAIPRIRGRLRSRSAESIAAEVKDFLAQGITEFNLVAQDLGSWGRDFSPPANLPALLSAILDIPGDFRLRLLYIHPEHFPREALALCRGDARLLQYFDLPFQHASGRVLAAMGRKWSAAENLALVRGIRQALPDAVIRSTFLVGFPGETDEDFQALRDFQEKAAFDWLGCFAYSAEEDTPAYALHGKKGMRVYKRIAAARKRSIEEAQIPITEKRLGRFVGTQAELLVEENVGGEKLALARAWFQAPEVDGLTVIATDTPLAPGTRVMAKITRQNGFDLEAVIVEK